MLQNSTPEGWVRPEYFLDLFVWMFAPRFRVFILLTRRYVVADS